MLPTLAKLNWRLFLMLDQLSERVSKFAGKGQAAVFLFAVHEDHGREGKSRSGESFTLKNRALSFPHTV